MDLVLGLAATVLVLVLLVSAAATAAVCVAARRLLLRNRVGAVRTGARLCWLLSPARAARLHRRLRDAVAGVRLVLPRRRRRSPQSPLVELADQLLQAAVAVDRRIVAASRQPGRARRDALTRLEADVAAVERDARRLVAIAAELRRGPAVGVEVVSERLDALEAAVADLRWPPAAPPAAPGPAQRSAPAL